MRVTGYFFLFLLVFGQLFSKESELLNREYYFHCGQTRFFTEIHDLARDCESIVAFSGSDQIPHWAMLHGLSLSPFHSPRYFLLSSEELVHPFDFVAPKSSIQMQRLKGPNLTVDFDEADFLYLDSLPTYAQLLFSLDRYASKVKKYIVIPGTSGPCENQNSPYYTGDFSEYPPEIHRLKEGLWPAVVDFLYAHPEWNLRKRDCSGEGYTLLQKTPFPSINQKKRAPITEALKNVILCTGPSLGHKERLKNVTEKDLISIPFKKIFVVTNDPAITDITFNGIKPHMQLVEMRGQQLDCLNCILLNLRAVALDEECKDEDIILFKHDTVYVHDMYLICKAIGKLLEGYEIVDRFLNAENLSTYYNTTDMFFMTVAGARKILEHLEEQFVLGLSCEVYFTYEIARRLNIYQLIHSHSNRGANEIGGFHINPPWLAPNDSGSILPFWSKENYNELY